MIPFPQDSISLRDSISPQESMSLRDRSSDNMLSQKLSETTPCVEECMWQRQESMQLPVELFSCCACAPFSSCVYLCLCVVRCGRRRSTYVESICLES